LEIWKDIEGYEGHYKISSTGRVKSLLRKCKSKNGILRTVPEKILTGTKDKDGYLKVSLNYEHILDICRIHRLVAKHFIPNPENKPVVNHKDGNKQNNNDWNLEWNSISQNTQHAYDFSFILKKKGEKNKASKLKDNQVLEIRRLFKTKKYKHSELAKLFNISSTMITRIVNNQNWKHI